MHIRLSHSKLIQHSEITITGSKSESNRLLLLQALYPKLEIKNVSNSDDSKVMKKALTTLSDTVDIHHAGTAMRFLTAYFAIQEEKEIVLTGSERMQERPIKILVDALRTLGADIKYIANEGFPPLKIKGTAALNNEVSLSANVSSQYISALLLIAPKLKHGLTLTLEGKITSVPYINMTLNLLKSIDVKTSFKNNVIRVKSKAEKQNVQELIVESDWSSASYFYSCIALGELGTEITLSSYKKDSLQGDSSLIELYKNFGVSTRFDGHYIILKKTHIEKHLPRIEFNLSNSPDLAQTIAVTCLGLGLKCHLTGLHTLKIKETDRLVALKNEIEKFGTEVHITTSTLTISDPKELNKGITIDTYKDHRMAMAFTPLALKIPFSVNNADVVSKSYPDFWTDLSKIGFQITES